MTDFSSFQKSTFDFLKVHNETFARAGICSMLLGLVFSDWFFYLGIFLWALWYYFSHLELKERFEKIEGMIRKSMPEGPKKTDPR